VEEGPKANLRRVKTPTRRAPLIRLQIRRELPGADLLVKRNRVIDP